MSCYIFKMVNMWNDAGADRSQPYADVTYTPGFEFNACDFSIADDHEHEQQPNSLEPDKATEAENSSQRKTKGVAKRNQNYSGNEDETLISAYLNVSKDQVVGINQPAKSYWQRILDYYNEFRTTTTTRTRSSLQHRWGEIQRDTTKFCGFYDEIERKNQSGKKKRAELAANPTEAGDGTSMDPIKVISEAPKFSRPMGRDRAKRLRGSPGVGSSASSTACLEVLQKIQSDRAKYDERQKIASKDEAQEVAARYERKLSLVQEQVDIQRKMLELHEKERMDKIMFMDLDKVQPWVRDFYIREQKKIAGWNDEASGAPPS
ncbi:hypothetical protein GQ55_3G254300 [Panicum hallii var. hallii]|uniref:No apical meristem-associated C-terminal domain-containing protein n=1 Tax=Panicum hallii var. hallii TaxID=1504633 RepID=A0A2T7ED97_9POAL|nr:hypothetical protein GQ55_3G254300 [Panicum hallii var. hallii]